MPRLFTDRRCLDHDPQPGHPEAPARLIAINGMLKESGLGAACPHGTVSPASDEQLMRIHADNYISQLKEISATGGGRIDADTVMGRQSLDVAKLAAGAAIAAVDSVFTTPEHTAIVLMRPPGHHALSDRAMGFCFFNNIAVAAAHAQCEHGLERILIVDWDVHHGNGTQDIFYADGHVGYLSIHRHPFYPGTGAADERGTAAGLGTTWNIPTQFGTPRKTIGESFAAALQQAADEMRPELILISAGFDAHAADPIGSLGLETEDFQYLTQIVRQAADAHAAGRIVSVLEGGYNPPILAECVQAHIEALQ